MLVHPRSIPLKFAIANALLCLYWVAISYFIIIYTRRETNILGRSGEKVGVFVGKLFGVRDIGGGGNKYVRARVYPKRLEN